MLPEGGLEAWVYPSEIAITPLWKDNCWRRKFLPRLQTANLQWTNFQVMRRTHSCLLDALGIDPQVRADQMGLCLAKTPFEFITMTFWSCGGTLGSYD